MDYHQNARLTAHSREQMVERGSTLKAAAEAFHVSAKRRLCCSYGRTGGRAWRRWGNRLSRLRVH
jgi:hypothetical protein